VYVLERERLSVDVDVDVDVDVGMEIDRAVIDIIMLVVVDHKQKKIRKKNIKKNN